MSKKKQSPKTIDGDLMSELVAIAKKAKDTKGEFHCDFCKKNFVQEKTFAVHSCEKRNRFNNQTTKPSQVGFHCWLKYYQYLYNTSIQKTFREFIDSQFYSAFVRFAAWCLDNGVFDHEAYLRYLMRNNKKLDQWTRESFYKEFLVLHVRGENVSDALERSILTIQQWAETQGREISDYFKHSSSNYLVSQIMSGKISPWVIYSCDSGQEAISELDAGQLQSVWGFVDPAFWQKKISDYPADSEMAKEILKQAML